ncbi:MAG: hypothetical protein MMC23_007503 [Stictis urceolatum]|nr:hypothetical protein [Stictis urceolata]
MSETNLEREKLESERSSNTGREPGTGTNNAANDELIELGRRWPDGPPPLPYNLKDHKLSIFWNWTLIVLDSACLPIILYWSLIYAAGVKPVITFAIITSVCGILSPIKYFFGILRLIKKDSDFIPMGSKRWRLDYFHVTFSVGYTAYLIELIIGSAPHVPIVRLLALPAPTLVFCMGIMILIPQLRYTMGKPHIYRVSSYDRGHAARPGVYPYIEDVVAVEGFGGLAWRQAIDDRYEASPYFQRMLSKLTWFWLAGCFIMPAVCAVVIALCIEPVGYTFGWAVPFIWAALWAWITILWTKRMLKKERANWPPTA